MQRLLRFPVSSDYCYYSVSVIVGGKVACNTCLRNMFLLGYKSILLRISVSILHFSVSFLNAGFFGGWNQKLNLDFFFLCYFRGH